jgi:hypothetical protein
MVWVDAERSAGGLTSPSRVLIQILAKKLGPSRCWATVTRTRTTRSFSQ